MRGYDQRLAEAAPFVMSKRAREEMDFPPQHQALGITGHTHATAEPEMQHILLTEKALADHAAAHFTDLVSAALTKMAIFHEHSTANAEAFYEFRKSLEYLGAALRRSSESKIFPISLENFDISNMDAFVKSNEFVSTFLPWLRRVQKDHADTKHCLANFVQAMGQFQDVCHGLVRVSAGIGAFEHAFKEYAFDRVSLLHSFHHRFIVKVQMQISWNALAGQQLFGDMMINDLLLGVGSDMERMESLFSLVQKLPEGSLQEHEEPELNSASLPNDVVISTNYTPSSVGSGPACRIHARSVSPILRPPISISGCLDAATRASAAQNFVNAHQYRMLADIHFRHAPSTADVAWALLTSRVGVPKDVKTAFKLVEKCEACPDSQGVLALCLYRGQGGAVDKMRAVPLARQSAAAGSRYGQFVLGCYYHDENDSANAAANYKLSAEQGLDAAYYELGCMSQLANALEEAAGLFRRAADQGFQMAFVKLADIADNETERAKWRVRSKFYENVTLVSDAMETFLESASGSSEYLDPEDFSDSFDALRLAAAIYARAMHTLEWVPQQSGCDGISASFHGNCVDSSRLFELSDGSSSNGSSCSDARINRSVRSSGSGDNVHSS
jgi:TPR repeat protein